MKKTTTILTTTLAALLLAVAPAQEAQEAQETPEAAPEAEAAAPEAVTATPEEATQRVIGTLSDAGGDVTEGVLVEDLRSLRLALETSGDDESRVIAAAIEPVEERFAADPFDRARLVEALERLALTLRVVAVPGDEALTVELASLVDGLAATIEDDEGYTPRLEVDTP